MRLARAALIVLWVACIGACAGGLPKVPATPEAVLQRADELQSKRKFAQSIALYETFLDRYAGHDRADYAQYQLGMSHFGAGDYPVAAVEFQVLMTSYGYSEWVDDALFHTGLSFWRDAPRPARDQQKSVDALSRFNQYLQTYPEAPLAPEARKYVTEIHTRLAEKALVAARWYQRRHEPKAAMIYCDKIIENYPGNDNWVEAVYLKGTILLALGRNEDAIAEFVRIRDYPSDHRLKRDAEARIREAQR